MYFKAIAGMVAGLSAGVVSGIMFLLMAVPDMSGETQALLGVIARLVGTNEAAVGWSFNLFCSTFVGAIYGCIAGAAVRTMPRALLSGVGVGLFCWAVSAVLLVPVLDSAVSGPASLVAPLARPIGLGLFIGNMVYGVLLGAIFLLVYLPALPNDPEPPVEDVGTARKLEDEDMVAYPNREVRP